MMTKATARSVSFTPPIAIARLGGSDTPVDAYRWRSDPAKGLIALEYDHRNLDCRFFPGLVVEFADMPDNQVSFGAVVIDVDLDDPLLADLPPESAGLRYALVDLWSMLAADGAAWWVVSFGQEGVVVDVASVPVWIGSTGTRRVVRSLEPGLVSLGLGQFRDANRIDDLTLIGPRRSCLGANEAMDGAYRAGELTQSLCSPWQHDFRDCGCYYWASNHPDIALEAAAPGEDATAPPPGIGWGDWLRAQPERPVAPQFAYYEINERFQELAVVLRDRETDTLYIPPVLTEPKDGPYGSPAELVAVLANELAPLQHVLIEHLWAWSSVRTPEEVRALSDNEVAEVLPLAYCADPEAPLGGVTDRPSAIGYLRRRLLRDVTFLREQLRATAISEMRHLSWVNELLRMLAEDGRLELPAYQPALGVAREAPTGTAGEARPAALRALDRETVAAFAAVQQPSGARRPLRAGPGDAPATDLRGEAIRDRQPHRRRRRRPLQLVPAHGRHRRAPRPAGPAPPQARLHLAAPDYPMAVPALETQKRVLALLREAFSGDPTFIGLARDTMFLLERELRAAAAAGLGVVPLFVFPQP